MPLEHLKNSFITEPGNNVVLWRYMDFPQFVSMLDRSSLWLARTDQFEDPWEGTYPPSVFDEHITQIMGQITNVPQSVTTWRKMIHGDDVRQSMFMNCWHAAKCESAAMWKLYSQSKEAIAIKTSVARIRTALTRSSQTIWIGNVHYTDFLKPSQKVASAVKTLNLMPPYFMKRDSFRHEREVRLLHWRVPNDESSIAEDAVGFYAAVHLSKLLESVWVAPQAAKWFWEIVGAVMRKYELQEIPLKLSRLYIRPEYRT